MYTRCTYVQAVAMCTPPKPQLLYTNRHLPCTYHALCAVSLCVESMFCVCVSCLCLVCMCIRTALGGDCTLTHTQSLVQPHSLYTYVRTLVYSPAGQAPAACLSLSLSWAGCSSWRCCCARRPALGGAARCRSLPSSPEMRPGVCQNPRVWRGRRRERRRSWAGAQRLPPQPAFCTAEAAAKEPQPPSCVPLLPQPGEGDGGGGETARLILPPCRWLVCFCSHPCSHPPAAG